MKSIADEVRANCPHMSEGMIELIELIVRQVIGDWATILLSQKTVGAVRHMLQGLQADGDVAAKLRQSWLDSAVGGPNLGFAHGEEPVKSKGVKKKGGK